MAVPAPNLKNQSIDQLMDSLVAGVVGSPMHQQATCMLQFRIAEKQAEAAAQQAQAANAMVGPTRDLAAFTKALARATWALFLVGGATGALTIVQVLIALGVIHK
jgi:hypothetical protein